MDFDFDDCEFNTVTEDLSGNMPVKITIDEPNTDPLMIRLSDWRELMKVRNLLRNTLHYLEDYSAALWVELRQNRNLDELIGEIKGFI